MDVWKLKHHNLDVNDTKRPAGCYWKSDGNGFFNNVLDPSSTNTNGFGDRGGLCNIHGMNYKMHLIGIGHTYMTYGVVSIIRILCLFHDQRSSATVKIKTVDLETIQ